MGNNNTNTNIVLNVKTKKKQGNNSVFIISLAITFIIVFWGILDKRGFEKMSTSALNFLTEKFG